MSVTQHTRINIFPWKILPGTKVVPGYKFGEKTRHKLPNGRRNMFSFWQAVGSRKCYIFCWLWLFFFLNRELFPIVRLHFYILLHFTFEFSDGAIPIPRPKLCSNVPILGSYRAIKRPFSSSNLKKRRSLNWNLLNLEMRF